MTVVNDERMKRFIPVFLFLFLSSPVYADDYQDGLDAYHRKEYRAAIEKWEPLAKRGDSLAQNKLGRMYNKGKGVVQDYKEAVRWFRLSAEQGDALAQKNLGRMYNKGKGVPKDFVQAHMWFNLAEKNGHESAFRIISIIEKRMTSKDIIEAQKLAREWTYIHRKE